MIIAWRGFCFRSSMCLWLLPLLFTITGWRTWQFIGDTDWTKLSTHTNNTAQFAQRQLMKTVVTHCYQVDQNYHQVDQGWRVPRQWDGAPRRGWSRHLVSILAVVGMIQASLNSDWSVILPTMKWNHWWSWGGVENSKFQPWRTLIFGIRSCEYSSLEAFWGYKAKFNLLLQGFTPCAVVSTFAYYQKILYCAFQSEHKVVHHFHCKRIKWTLKIFSTSQNITHASNTDCAFRNLKSNTAVIFQQIALEEGSSGAYIVVVNNLLHYLYL